MSQKSEVPKYGVLFSVRCKAKGTNDLVNLISIKFGSSIHWREPSCIVGADNSDSVIWRKNLKDPPIWFKTHGNKFRNFLELYCQDIAILEAVKAAFPNDFPTEVQVKEGLC